MQQRGQGKRKKSNKCKAVLQQQKRSITEDHGTHRNMHDIRNSLGITFLQVKIEERSLQSIGHVLRMDNEKPVKKTIRGWLPEIETTAKQKSEPPRTIGGN